MPGGRNRLRLPEQQKKWINNSGEQIIVIYIWEIDGEGIYGKLSFLDREPLTMIHADSMSFLTFYFSSDDQI